MTVHRSARTSAFSVIELLISTAILGLLLLIGASMMQSASDAYQTTSDVTVTQERLDAITQIVRYDLRLAGYTGADGADLLGGGAPFAWEADTDTLVVRYNEDRYDASGRSLSVTYARTGSTLTRQVASSDAVGTANDLLDGVSDLDVVVERDADNVAVGLRFNLSLADGTSVSIAARLVNP